MSTENDQSPWKWNIFYFNVNDKRVFVPKRISQLGMTLNFAHPVSFIIVAAIVGLICFLLNNH